MNISTVGYGAQAWQAGAYGRVCGNPAHPSPALQEQAGASRAAGYRAGETLEVSKESIRTNLMQSFLDGAAADGVVTAEELQAFRDRHAAAARTIVSDTLKQLGIPADRKFSVRVNEYNHVCVTGSLSEDEARRLGEALESGTDFVREFNATSSVDTVLTAAKHHMEFAEAYAKDPKAALSRFAWLIGADWKTRLDYDGGAMRFETYL